MKCFLKIICFIGGVLALLKGTQVLIDVLYDSYGKKYITTTE